MNDFNIKISKLSGLFLALANEIYNDENIKKGEKFIILQRLYSDIMPAIKLMNKLEKDISTYAIENLFDTGDGMSEEIIIDGASVQIKYTYVKDAYDAEKTIKELKRLYADMGVELDEKLYTKESTPRKKVIIQSILDR